MIVRCKCGYEEEVEWKISAYGLVEAVISFKCIKCGTLIKLNLFFPNDGKSEFKKRIEYDNASYIG